MGWRARRTRSAARLEAETKEPHADRQGDEGDGQPEGGEEEPAARQKIKIKLADGKERTIQHMMATTFWSVGRQAHVSGAVHQRLFGDLPELFKDEDELSGALGPAGYAEGAFEKPFGKRLSAMNSYRNPNDDRC